jgi:hypothetical protein
MRIDLNQLEFIDPILREMAISVEHHFGVEFTVTSLLRLPVGGSSNHQQLPLRAIDLRCYDDALGFSVEEYVNSVYEYDYHRPSKKACLFHDVGQGWHLHLQVHPNTRLK